MSERSYTRRDTVMFLGCLGLSIVSLFAPSSWGQGAGAALRHSVLAPLVWLQERAEEGKTSRSRLQSVMAQRDSLANVVQALPALEVENQRLRRLLELSRRVSTPYVAAEVLHQTQATDGRALLVGAGARVGVTPLDPVVAPEGLIGMVLRVSPGSSVVMTWADPEFRVSAFASDGSVSGIVAPSSGEGTLEFRGVAYRDSVPNGTVVLTSGLGGVYPKGIPIGTIAGVVREQAGWERVYRIRPAADPGSTSHILVLTAPRRGDVGPAFVNDSAAPAPVLQPSASAATTKAAPAPTASTPAAPTRLPSPAAQAPAPTDTAKRRDTARVAR